MRTILGFLVLLTPFVFAGCPNSIGTVDGMVQRWDFTMGNVGGGIISFNAVGVESGEKSGVCRDPICRMAIDDLTVMRLTPLANEGMKFRAWQGDPATGLSCDAQSQNTAGTIQLTVSRNGACIAVFEGGTTTTPGVRNR